MNASKDQPGRNDLKEDVSANEVTSLLKEVTLATCDNDSNASNTTITNDDNIKALIKKTANDASVSGASIDATKAAEKDNSHEMEMDDDEVEFIEEEDISGANKPGVSDNVDSEDAGDPDYCRYEDPQDFELNEEYNSSSSSGSEGERVQDVQSDNVKGSSDCSDNSKQSSTTDPRTFHSKRTAQQSIPYNFKLMTQELASGQSKFMENFDPERSNREKRKLTRKTSTKKATVYDDAGLMGLAQLDICDCMSEECPGCHFPCPKCFSNKCGHECRQNRRWMYEEIQIEGTDITIQNPAYNSASNEPL